MLRTVQSRISRLQSELEVETRTNNEFEEASRRSFTYLSEQVEVLKDGFNKLSDGVLEELETVVQRFNKRFDLMDSEMATNPEFERLLEKTNRKHEELLGRQESATRDVDAILDVIPKLENKIDAVRKEMEDMSMSIRTQARDGDSSLNRFEAQLQRMERESAQRLERQEVALREDIREELEQRTLHMQRSITQQMENMSKLLKETSFSVSPPSARKGDSTARRFDAGLSEPSTVVAARIESNLLSSETPSLAQRRSSETPTLSGPLSATRSSGGGISPAFSMRSSLAEMPRSTKSPTKSLTSPSRIESLRSLRLP
jgi:myosin heavy subunit